jgi:hypothetical protein
MMRTKQEFVRIFSLLWLKYAFCFHHFLIVLSCIRWIDIKGIGWMAEKDRVSGLGSRISYEFSAQERGFEK